MNKQTLFALVIAALLMGGVVFLGYPQKQPTQASVGPVGEALAAKFQDLSQNGNSSCSGQFKDSIVNMPDTARLKGSCCSPMSIHRYGEQVEGLKN